MRRAVIRLGRTARYARGGTAVLGSRMLTDSLVSALLVSRRAGTPQLTATTATATGKSCCRCDAANALHRRRCGAAVAQRPPRDRDR